MSANRAVIERLVVMRCLRLSVVSGCFASTSDSSPLFLAVSPLLSLLFASQLYRIFLLFFSLAVCCPSCLHRRCGWLLRLDFLLFLSVARVRSARCCLPCLDSFSSVVLENLSKRLTSSADVLFSSSSLSCASLFYPLLLALS